VVICVGKNKYRHPDFGVLRLLDKHKIPVYRTDVDKMLYFDYEGKNIAVKRYSSELRAIQ
jgi:beta-lactamase superfamily II metal-dependent hydrolase